jgi:hypothetical protein
MRILSCSAALAALVAFLGCASHPPYALNETVGPSHPRASRPGGKGGLIVYSASEVVDQAESFFPTHSGYTIYLPDGQRLRKVDNRTGSFDQEPVTVTLPAGEYSLRARATNVGWVSVPVVIQAGRTTVVHLDGRRRASQGAASADHWVRLPDGQIVGSRADQGG